MEIKRVEDKELWNNFLKEKEGGFLQSWQWGEFKKRRQEVLRLGAFKGGRLMGVCQLFKEKLPLGSYFYIPYGPVVDETIDSEQLIEAVKEEIEKQVDFLRIEPTEEITVGKKSFSRHQPNRTLIIDLKEEDRLLSEFDKDTRYSIRRANREGVEVKEGTSIESFYKLLNQASKRHGFGIYSKDYYRKLLELDIVKLFEATHEGDVLASAFTVFFGNMATYLHAGSSRKKRKFCGSTLLNFEIMNHAFESGFEKYDFWGIDKKKMPGVTKFKKGFGGKEVVCPDAIDIAFNSKYKMYKKAYQIKSSL